MRTENLSTPVLFIAFNRPDMTRRVFAVIRQVRPSRLYIAIDGPRDNKFEEDLKVQEVRAYVMGSIDWECEVKTLFREKNFGCKKAVSSAIDWFFENEEEGIIIEDDCLPDVSFFPFCAQLLEKYRHDERVMMISGANFQRGKRMGSHSYCFSKYCHIWGWATWRRAWKHYDVAIQRWPQCISNGFLKTLDAQERYYWRWCFNHVFSGRLDTWDYQWVFACWMNKGLAVMPAVNLVSNIGFGDDSTHTKGGDLRGSAYQIERMQFPLTHPKNVVADRHVEELSRNTFFKMSALKYVWRTFKEKVGLT